MQFGFATAGEILFGPGVLEQGVERMAAFGGRFLVITGGNVGRAEPLVMAMRQRNMEPVIFSVPEEPSVPLVEEGAEAAREARCDAVIGIGGGSAMDAAKAVAALLANPGGALRHLEVVGQGLPLDSPAAPCVAIPTTAGTGAEVTRNAVLVVPEQKVKVSLRHVSMLPRLAIVDPVLSMGMPRELTAATGLDALTQLMEAYVSRKATPLTDGICLEGLVRAARSLPAAWQDGSDARAREEMCLASLFSGLALANGGLGAVHGLAAPLGGLLGAAHGMICAALLPHVLRANLHALQQAGEASFFLERFRHMAGIVTGEEGAGAEAAADWVAALCERFGVSGLGALGLEEGALDEVVTRAQRASSMKGNPVELSDVAVRGILEAAL